MRAGIALGSNAGDRLASMRRARTQVLGLHGVSEPVGCSRIYETDPVGMEPGSSPFLNAVIEVEFTGHPATLLDALHAIEASTGRLSKRPRNAPRVIDLDLLYAGNITLASDEIVIPHPRLHLRRFVLQPLCDLRPELVLPGYEVTVSALLAGLDDPARVEVFSEAWEP